MPPRLRSAAQLAPVLNAATKLTRKGCAAENVVNKRTRQAEPKLVTPALEIVAPPPDDPKCNSGLLLDLGALVQGVLVKRPSSTIKSPYVADVRLDDGSLVLAHAPSLGCGGMAVPGATVYMSAKAADSTALKTSHAIQVVEDVRSDDGTSTKVGYHPFLAERLALQLLERQLLESQLGRVVRLERQRTYGATRVDFVLHGPEGKVTLLEVKNVVCADFPAGRVPAGRSDGVYTSSAQPYSPTAIFPHGSKKPGVKVVSDRAIKHVHELSVLHEAGVDNEGRPVSCAVMFVVNRSDCTSFRPCHEADLLFAQVLKRAHERGMKLLAIGVDWEGGRAAMGKQLPVVFDQAVRTCDIDEGLLQEVLDYNADRAKKQSRSRVKNKG